MQVENVAGIRAKENLNLKVTQNANLKGAVLEGGNQVNLQANHLNIEDLKDTSTSSNNNWGVGYTYTFGSKPKHDQKDYGLMNKNLKETLNNVSKTIDDMNVKALNFNVNNGKSSSTTITAVHGGINKLDNIDVNSVNLNLDSIYTDTQNNKEVIYHKQTNQEINIAPGEWLTATKGAIDVVNTYSEISPVGAYYYMEDNWGDGIGTGPDLFPNLPCFGLCDDLRIFGKNVTGVNGSTRPDGLKWWNPETWQYDNSGGMETFNVIVPGAQSWSKMHDFYLEDANRYRPYGSNTQLTIIPFFLLGTYGGMYGSIYKPIKRTIDYINNLRGNNK